MSNWQNLASPQGQLLAAEPQQAVTPWAARPLSLLGPVVHTGRTHDGSSSEGLNQEMIMEEVKRQVITRGDEGTGA